MQKSFTPIKRINRRKYSILRKIFKLFFLAEFRVGKFRYRTVSEHIPKLFFYRAHIVFVRHNDILIFSSVIFVTFPALFRFFRYKSLVYKLFRRHIEPLADFFRFLKNLFEIRSRRLLRKSFLTVLHLFAKRKIQPLQFFYLSVENFVIHITAVIRQIVHSVPEFDLVGYLIERANYEIRQPEFIKLAITVKPTGNIRLLLNGQQI